jgi:hypothetical protein
VDKRYFLAAMAIELDEWLKNEPEAPDREEARTVGTSFSTPSRFAAKANASRPYSQFTLRANPGATASIWMNG